jgi:hypothetical protein
MRLALAYILAYDGGGPRLVSVLSADHPSAPEAGQFIRMGGVSLGYEGFIKNREGQ